MKSIPGEQILREAGDEDSDLYFVLTTHRIRLTQRTAGQGEIVSMMLDQISSCGVAQRSRPVFLGLAALAVIVGAAAIAGDDSAGPLFVALIVALLFVVVYFASKQQVLEVRSSSATARMNARGMRAESAEDFIDAVETAQNNRYRLR